MEIISSKNFQVVVTRAEGRSDALVSGLTSYGIDVHDIPLTRIERFNEEELRGAVSSLSDYRWLVLTSVNGVEAFASAVDSLDASDAVSDLWIAAVGDVTANAIEQHGWTVDLIPSVFTAYALLNVLSERPEISGNRILYPCASGSSDVIAEGLVALGASVDAIACYGSVPDRIGQEKLSRLISQRDVDLIVVAAPSAVDALASVIPPEFTSSINLASIGPVTSKAAKHAGFKVAVEASPYTSEGLVRAILAWKDRLR